ncbi:MAG: tRNA uridine-5-carboxymethylaminomethyl(34) synthesis GTPase MnmE, partial [Planctomycetes bacterium]|nr:tRNA uridine-5-carboxymethylaminomethyl(34) synthesis GTPase MnmE [Planctomycetota bacterium]
MAARTIAALATPPLPSALALLRVAGPLAGAIAASLGVTGKRCSSPVKLRLPCGLTPALAWFAAGPATYTGDDTLELFVPGHPALWNDALDWLLEQGCVRAEPGEFTRRA